MTKKEFYKKLDNIRDIYYSFEPELEDTNRFNLPFALIQIISILMDIMKGINEGERLDLHNLINYLYYEMKNHYSYETKEEFYDIFINILSYILESKKCRYGFLSLNTMNEKLIKLTEVYDMGCRFSEEQNSYEYIQNKYKTIYLGVRPNEIIHIILKLKTYGYDPDDLDYRCFLDTFYSPIEKDDEDINHYKAKHNRYDECYKIVSELFENENFPKTKEWKERNEY